MVNDVGEFVIKFGLGLQLDLFFFGECFFVVIVFYFWNLEMNFVGMVFGMDNVDRSMEFGCFVMNIVLYIFNL